MSSRSDTQISGRNVHRLHEQYALVVDVRTRVQWTYSRLNLKVPILATVIHELFVGTIFIIVPTCIHCCCSKSSKKNEAEPANKRSCSTKCLDDWRFLPTSYLFSCRVLLIIFGLSIASAFNYGLVAISLMRLSHPDHQMLRSLVPIFTALFFFALEKRQLTVIQFIALLLTACGAALAVSTHNSFWQVDMAGVFICLAANVASAFQLSLIAIVSGVFHKILCNASKIDNLSF